MCVLAHTRYAGPVDTPEAVLEHLLAATDEPMAAAEAAVKDAQERVEAIRAERYGLQLALARLREQSPDPKERRPSKFAAGVAAAAAVLTVTHWRQMDRTDAIVKVLQDAGKPIHRTAIVARLHEHGRDDTIELVSAALAYLKKKMRVMNYGNGYWSFFDLSAAADEWATNADDPAEAGSSSV